MQALEHDLEHARPFGAVAGQLCARRRINGSTHVSMEPSRAAASSICSLGNMLPLVERPAQTSVAGSLGKFQVGLPLKLRENDAAFAASRFVHFHMQH